MLLSKTGTIEWLDLPSTGDVAEVPAPIHVDYARAHNSNGVPDIGDVSEREMFELTGKMIVDRLPETSSSEERKDVFGEVERCIALAALERTRGNKQAAANLLGIYRPRLYGILKRHSIKAGE